MLIDPSRVRVRGPLAPFATGFAEELRRQGYTPLSARNQMWLMAQLSRWLLSEGLDACDLSAADLDRFLCARHAAGCKKLRSIKATRPIIAYLYELNVARRPSPPEPAGAVEGMLERYRIYLTVERGLGRETARGYVDSMRHFLNGRVSADGLVLNLGHLSATDVVSFVVARCPRQGCSAAKLTATALRSLPGFLHVSGLIERSLTSSVPSIASRRLAGLPKGLEPDQVLRLLTSCDKSTVNGSRDFAVLTMLVRLGMRAGEVAKLRLEDVDWRAGAIVVRGKANCDERVPLSTDVGEAPAAYLRRARPASADGRTVFVRFKAPHRAITSGGVTQIVAAAARRAGLGLIHAHRPRHTAATQMLRAGATLPEVGQVLRHRRAMTTAIYAKVDREALRTLARQWPGNIQ